MNIERMCNNMKIAFINETFGTGSIGRLTKELAEGLIQCGHEVRYYYSQGKGNADYCLQISTQNSVRIHAVLSRITGLQGYFSTYRTYQLIKELRGFKPSIIHLQNLHSNYINLKILSNYLHKTGIPTVITLHDCWFYTGKCTYYVPAKCDRWKIACGKCPLLHKDNVNPTWFFDTTHKCLMDKKKWFASLKKLAVVGVSDWITEEARNSIYKCNVIKRIYNWVNHDIFFYRTNDFYENLHIPKVKVILMVSTVLSEKKGYKELCFLAERLPREYQLVFVGKNKLNLEIPQNVIQVDHVNCAEKMAEYYSVAYICVNTTQYETFGMVTAESMSCGTPVIVYDNTASPELIGSGCGLVVKQSEGMQGILNAINRINTWDRNATRKRCVEYANNRFKKDIAIEQYINLYRSLLKES